jgi:hypothetical protein
VKRDASTSGVQALGHIRDSAFRIRYRCALRHIGSTILQYVVPFGSAHRIVGISPHSMAAVFDRKRAVLEATSCFAMYDMLRSFITFELSDLCAGNGAVRRAQPGASGPAVNS